MPSTSAARPIGSPTLWGSSQHSDAGAELAARAVDRGRGDARALAVEGVARAEPDEDPAAPAGVRDGDVRGLALASPRVDAAPAARRPRRRGGSPSPSKSPTTIVSARGRGRRPRSWR